jgi:hypothetical protein
MMIAAAGRLHPNHGSYGLDIELMFQEAPLQEVT